MDAAAAVGDGRRIDFFLAACASLVKVDRSWEALHNHTHIGINCISQFPDNHFLLQ